MRTVGSVATSFIVCLGLSLGALAAEPGTPAGVTRIAATPDDASAVLIDLDGRTLLVDGSLLNAAQAADPQVQAARWRVETSASGRSRPVAGSALQLVPLDGATIGDAGFRDRLDLAGGATILELGRGLSADDLAVYLPQRGILVVGDLAGPDPAIGEATDTGAWIENLRRLEHLGATSVIPAKGAIGGTDLLVSRRQSLETIRRQVEDDVLAGASWAMVRDSLDGRTNRDLAHHVYGELAGTVPPRELIEDRGLREGPSPNRSDANWTPPRRVVWRNLWPDRLVSLAAVAPGVEIVPVTTAEEAAAQATDADAVVGFLTPEILAAGTNLRWVQVPWAGVEDEVAISGLADRDLVLTNGQRLASPEIADHVMALTRALARRLDRAFAAQARGSWDRTAYRGDDDLIRLRGKTLLVVGLGGIGTEVARLADGAGMTVLATRSSRREGPDFVDEVGLAADLPAFAARADVVVNCLPLTAETTGLFNLQLFRAMRPKALFVNVGRGGSVVTADLITALETGEIGGAGLDVTYPEPLPADHPLWKAPNVIITPHSAAVSDAGRERLWLLFRENLRRFAAGDKLLSVVDVDRGY
jgi:phosphoglycerate dehydrogenase-like enzyme/glyoxylase-like metal-dependent hydrolase (beta-lactamase superfamily II)